MIDQPFAEKRWPEIEADSITLAVPVGSVEQHGPHLPLDTDARIAHALAARLPGTELAPTISFGASGEHEGFPGTVSIGAAALELLLLEFGRSACRWAQRVLFVNGHGGNIPAIIPAVRQLRYEGREVAWLPASSPGGDAHAGYTETSLMLRLHPELVRLEAAEAGRVEPIETLMPVLRRSGVAAVSPNGVLGDPAGASSAAGARILDAMVAQSIAALEHWRPRSDGMLGRHGGD